VIYFPAMSLVTPPVGPPLRYHAPDQTIDRDPDLGWIRRMGPMLRRHRWSVIGSLLMALVAVGTQVMVPLVTRQAIDNGLTAQTTPVTAFVIALVVLSLTRGLFAFGYRYGLYGMAYRIDFDLRAAMYRHLTRLSFSFYDRTQSGQIISRANSDIKAVQLYLALAPLLATSVVGFFISLAVMLWISVPLTLVAVAPLPLVYLVGVALRNQVFPLSWIIQARTAELVTIVDETITGTRVVKSFGAERHQISQLSSIARRLRWSNIRQADSRARWGPIMENLPRLGLAAVLIVGGWLVIDGQATVGDIVLFNSYILVMQVPFRLLGFFLILGQRAKASALRIYEILDETADIVDRDGAQDLVDVLGDVRFDRVSFGYGDGPGVLHELDLHLHPGETVALVGRTGCGKSTVARMLPRFYDVRTGSVTIDGVDVRDVTLTSLRSTVGLVLDEPFLFSASIRDNIAYARPDASESEVAAVAAAAQATDFIEALPDGYETVIGERGYTLSGGQRQRIAIARTLLADPPVLVLDDATSAIDVGVEDKIHTALEELLGGRTTLVIAHRLSTISLATRVAVMEGGRVVALGTHTELLATVPLYAEILTQAAEVTQ